MLDVSAAFTKGRRGLSVWLSPGGEYQVSVRQPDGSFSVGIAPTVQAALAIALREDDDLL